MNDEIKEKLKSIYDSWFGATSKPKTSFTTHTINELDKAGYEIVKKDKWQPIDTAPKDEMFIWTYKKFDGKWSIGLAYQNVSGTFSDVYGYRHGYRDINKKATHWQPLPEPPKE